MGQEQKGDSFDVGPCIHVVVPLWLSYRLVSEDEVLMPYLRVLSTFRDSVRRMAINRGDTASKDILALCDKLRDSDLVPLGVALDDQEDGKALVKLVSPEELIKVRDEKRAALEAKAAKKAAAVEAERQKRVQKLEKGRIPPELMFRPRIRLKGRIEVGMIVAYRLPTKKPSLIFFVETRQCRVIQVKHSDYAALSVIKEEDQWLWEPKRICVRHVAVEGTLRVLRVDLQILYQCENLLKNVDDGIKTTTKSRAPGRCSEYPFGQL
ncbi:cysteinyl-tRNA synthetase [Salix suchowensis]|nr:cysteinyl-tRNA synthetase [Salix suchowensis]